MSLNQQVIAEFSPCTPSAPQTRDLSIQTNRYLSALDECIGDFATTEDGIQRVLRAVFFQAYRIRLVLKGRL